MRAPGFEELMRWEAFRGKLRKRRQDMGLRQSDVAERMNRSTDYVANLENNPRSIPNLTTIWLWCDALNVPLTLDLSGEGS